MENGCTEAEQSNDISSFKEPGFDERYPRV
jgi:hypothetical protein